MQNVRYTIIFAAVLLLSLAAAAHCVEEDTRLSKPVTITATDVRLHTVLEQIAKTTGVDIRCGKDNKDWQVRDIPVIVCVKDMPLGKLLNLIADSTHLALAARHSGDDNKENEPLYRIYRDQKHMDNRDEQYKAIVWEWNAMAALGKLPNLDEIKIDSRRYRSYGFSERRKAMARLVASLPPDTIDRILNGETITLTTKTAPQSSDVTGLYRIVRGYSFGPEAIGATFFNQGFDPEMFKLSKEQQEAMLPDEQREFLKEIQSEPPSADVDKATVTIKLVESVDGRPLIRIFVRPIVLRGDITIEWNDALLGKFMELTGYPPCPEEIPELALPEKPVVPNDDELQLQFDKEGSKFYDIGDNDLPILKTKLHLDLPKNKTLNYGDILAAVAKAGDFNIVAEDFNSHKRRHQGGDALLSIGADITVEDVLKCIRRASSRIMGIEDWWWLVNPEDKTIMGWSHNWRKHHLNMVPESLISSLEAKANGKGLELDDVMSLHNLTTAQRDEWLSMEDVYIYYCLTCTYETLWQLYAMLTPQEKAITKTQAGLPLFQVGLERLRYCLDEIERRKKYGDDRCYEIWYSKEWSTERELRLAALSDPEFASTLVMRVRKAERHEGDVGTNYEMEIKGKMGADEFAVVDNAGHPFPIYSKKRKAELGISPK